MILGRATFMSWDKKVLIKKTTTTTVQLKHRHSYKIFDKWFENRMYAMYVLITNSLNN